MQVEVEIRFTVPSSFWNYRTCAGVVTALKRHSQCHRILCSHLWAKDGFQLFPHSRDCYFSAHLDLGMCMNDVKLVTLLLLHFSKMEPSAVIFLRDVHDGELLLIEFGDCLGSDFDYWDPKCMRGRCAIHKGRILIIPLEPPAAELAASWKVFHQTLFTDVNLEALKEMPQSVRSALSEYELCPATVVQGLNMLAAQFPALVLEQWLFNERVDRAVWNSAVAAFEESLAVQRTVIVCPPKVAACLQRCPQLGVHAIGELHRLQSTSEKFVTEKGWHMFRPELHDPVRVSVILTRFAFAQAEFIPLPKSINQPTGVTVEEERSLLLGAKLTLALEMMWRLDLCSSRVAITLLARTARNRKMEFIFQYAHPDDYGNSVEWMTAMALEVQKEERRKEEKMGQALDFEDWKWDDDGDLDLADSDESPDTNMERAENEDEDAVFPDVGDIGLRAFAEDQDVEETQHTFLSNELTQRLLTRLEETAARRDGQ